jgi:hypothetical protein
MLKRETCQFYKSDWKELSIIQFERKIYPFTIQLLIPRTLL